MLPFVFSMEQKTSPGPVWTAGNDVREDGAEPGRLRRAGSGQPRRARRLPDDHDPRRPVVGLPPSRRSCSADTREPPDQAGPGSSRCHTWAPRRRAASGKPRVWPRKATLRSTASAPCGATAPGLLPPPGSSPPLSHPRPTGRRCRPGGWSCLPVLRQRPLPRFVTPAPG